MRRASELALKDSVRIWLVDQISPYVFGQNVAVSVDLSGGINNAIWARTLRFKDKTGGVMKASNREVLVDPWNPVSGTNWAYDQVILRGVDDWSVIYNPYTGLPMPNRFEEVTMDVEKDVPTMASSPWLKLKFVDSVPVPADAWFGWNSTTKGITNPPNGTYAKAKITVNYGDILGKVKYHDGSTMSLSDWLAIWPLVFERADPSSQLYDESSVATFEAFRDVFRGQRLVSKQPLVLEYYTNYTNIEAEFIASSAAEWPDLPWQVMTMGILAEERGKLAFSSFKAKEEGVEWMNYIGGSSLPILSGILNEANSTLYEPFREFAGKYITPQEASTRYQNLMNWYSVHHHFWVASGPFYLDKVDFTGHIAVAKAFRDYSFRADRWAGLTEPTVPDLSVTMPPNIVPGIEASFNLSITSKGQPYPNDRVDFVKYLVLDSTGNVTLSGEASAMAQGQWKIRLEQNRTARLSSGTYTLMTIALSKEIATPGVLETAFVVIPEAVYFRSLLTTLESKISADLSALRTSMSKEVLTLQGSINTLQGITYAAVIISIIAVVVATYSIISKRKT